jgi:hypothetical protein
MVDDLPSCNDDWQKRAIYFLAYWPILLFAVVAPSSC